MSDVRIKLPETHQGYFKLWEGLKAEMPWGDNVEELLTKIGPEEFKARSDRFIQYMRSWFKRDLYALMRFGLSHGDRVHNNVNCRWLDQPFLYKTVRQLDAYNRTGELHRKWLYWQRGGWKTSSIQALIVQRILIKSDIRIHYYSRTEPFARDRAGGIKLELETNPLLFYLFPEVLWGPDPKENGAEDWSDGSFTVRRDSMGRAAEAMSESTVKCYGINAVGTGGHPEMIILDDCVDDTNAHSGTMVNKTARQMSAAVKASDPSDTQHRQDWVVGTEYSTRSAYKVLQEQGMITSVWHESAVDFEKYGGVMQQKEFDQRLESGEIEGVLLTNAELRDYRGKGPKKWVEFCHQYLCRLDMAKKPTLDVGKLQVFPAPVREVAARANIYILEDPAGYPGLSQERELCDSAIGVVALCDDGNIRWIDGILDLMDAARRCRWIMRAARRWRVAGGNLIEARIEEGGTGGDVSFLAELQQRESYTFPIVRVTRGGGSGALGKIDRINDRVGPLMEKLCLPPRMVRERRGQDECIVQVLRQAMADFPGGSDDQFNLLDMFALLSEPVDKTVQEFCGSKDVETRPLGPLKWPRQSDWRVPLSDGQTLADQHPEHRGMLGLFGAANVPANFAGGRRRRGTTYDFPKELR